MTYFMISADRRGTPLWWSVAAGDFVEVQDNGTQFVRDRDAATLASRLEGRPGVANAKLVELGANPASADKHPGAVYVADCLRTEYTPDFVRLPTPGGDPEDLPETHWSRSHEATRARDKMIARLIHAVLGLMSEVGEIADHLKKVIIYGKEIDLVNLIEELGDESWYQSLLLDAIGGSWEEAWAKNIAKLRARYPEKFTQEQALHRNLNAERAVLERPQHVVKFVINGHDVEVGGLTILEAIIEARRVSHNTARLVDDYELRDSSGVIIERARWQEPLTVLASDQHYYLTLQIGAGG